MPAIPLPFVIALLLAVLLLRLVMLREPTLRPAVGFVAACIAVAAIVGARWTFDWPVVRFLQPVLASGLPPIAWLCFTAGQDKNGWLHALPPALVLVLSALWPLWRSPVDLVLALLYFGYGAALLRLALTGPDSFVTTRLSDVAGVHKATLAAGALLITSAFVDLLIAVDFGFYQGTHAAWIVTAGNLLVLPVLAYVVAVIGRSIPPEDADNGPKPAVSNEEDQRILDAVDRLMREKQLFRDPDLTLNRIAPARWHSGPPDIRRRQPAAGTKRLATRQRLPDRGGQASVVRDRDAGHDCHVRSRLPDQVELQSRIPAHGRLQSK